MKVMKGRTTRKYIAYITHGTWSNNEILRCQFTISIFSYDAHRETLGLTPV